MAIRAKDSILDVGRLLNKLLNTNPKYLVNDYWWALEGFKIKESISTKSVILVYIFMTSLHSVSSI